MNKKYILLFCWVFCWLQGCVEEYVLPESSTTLSYLVVDATVLVEARTASIKLSRTQNLADAAKAPAPETKAVVHLEDTQNQRYLLSERANGLYTAAGLPIGYGQEYRLRIKTTDGREYLSALVSAQQTPPISEVTWHVEREGIQVEVNSTGEDNGSRLYQWEFTETYEYDAPFFSYYKYEAGNVVRREENDYIFTCWRTMPASRNILLGSTRQLEHNVISQKPITFIEGNSELLSKKYSILVRQYALSQEEYNYWQLMEKNTENVGSLFDAQPSFVTGNLTCITDPEAAVFGYFSVKSVAEKRLFIDAKELLPYNFSPPRPFCEVREVGFSEIPPLTEQGFLILSPLDTISTSTSFSVVYKNCADCQVKGGSTNKPNFWP